MLSIPFKIYHSNNNGYHSHQEALISYLIYCASVIICSLVLIHAIYHFYCKKTVESSIKWINYSLMTSLTFNLIYSGTTLMVASKNILTPTFFNCWISSINTPMIGVARVSLYFFFITRFYGVFKGTPMNLKSWTYKSMIILIPLSTIIVLGGFYVSAGLSNCADFPRFYFAVAAIFADLFWSFITFWIFFSRLRGVAKLIVENEKHNSKYNSSRDPSTISSNSSNSNRRSRINTDSSAPHAVPSASPGPPSSNRQSYSRPMSPRSRENHKIAEKNYSMLKLSIKLAVLSSCTALSSIMAVIGAVWLNPALPAAIDVCINGICVMISFSFNKKYWKVMCYPCRYCCEIPFFEDKKSNGDKNNSNHNPRLQRAHTRDFLSHTQKSHDIHDDYTVTRDNRDTKSPRISTGIQMDTIKEQNDGYTTPLENSVENSDRESVEKRDEIDGIDGGNDINPNNYKKKNVLMGKRGVKTKLLVNIGSTSIGAEAMINDSDGALTPVTPVTPLSPATPDNPTASFDVADNNSGSNGDKGNVDNIDNIN